nr:MAG TPA: hypothetical protein [Caudoviricetes sp.]
MSASEIYACSQLRPVAAATARTTQSPTLLPRGFRLNLCHTWHPLPLRPVYFFKPPGETRNAQRRTNKKAPTQHRAV